MDDFSKLERARSGDRKAWSYLYVKYYDRVLSEAETVAADGDMEAEPEDLLQKYWIQSIQTGPVAMREAAESFDAWLEEDFRRWWKDQATRRETDGFLTQPGPGRASRAL